MDISGINKNYFNSSVENAKNKVSDSDFESKLKNAISNGDDKELKKVCQEFEGLLLNSMYKQMKATIQKSNLIPSDTGTEIFESMLDDQLVEESTKNRSIGLADMLYKQLSRQPKTDDKSVQEGDKSLAEDK